MSSFWRGSFNYQFEVFGFTRPGIEPGTFQTLSECSTMRLQRWFHKHLGKLAIKMSKENIRHTLILSESISELD